MNKVLLNILKSTKKDLTLKKSKGKFLESILKPGISIIAEIKLASPTEKKLGSEKDILKKAIEYQKSGADAISFITEKSVFNGDIKFIPLIKSKVNLSVLQKDFVIDKFQIYEAKLAGSDALLLIAKILDAETLEEFVNICREIGLEPVVEINDEKDLKKALNSKTKIIAVNARNLDNLEIDLDNACRLLKMIPPKFVKLGFSGIFSKVEVEKYKKAGAKGILIGTNLMKAENTENFLKGLI